jgi:hypothetical protein
MTKARTLLRRWHIWLGWVVALPFLLWTVSGLVMVAKPIEEVRGEGLIGEAPLLPFGTRVTPPQIGPRPVSSIVLEQRSDGPKWLIRYADGASRLAEASTGRLLPPITAAEAASLLKARYTGPATIAAVDRTSTEDPPIDFRRKVEAWRITMSDGTRFYLSAATGEILAKRTGWWRFYDLMWALHIMDLRTREDTHNPLVIGFGILALVTTILAIALLPATIRRRGRS